MRHCFVTLALIAVLVPLFGCTLQRAISPTQSASPNIEVEVLAEDLDIPWAMDFAPDGRIFVTERPGYVRIIKDGHLQSEPWIALDVVHVGEGGLLGLALDPEFAQNHFVYVYYTYRSSDGQLQNRLVRLRDDPPSGKGAVDKVLLDGVKGAPNHDAGRIKFGPDRRLYLTTGDAQIPELAQDLSSLNGKILRLNADGTIPADNPFPGSPIYSYGHRNPEGLAWQPGAGRLYATEHGSAARDEVNYIEPGKNYGWPVITGNETGEGMVLPVLQSGLETWAPGGATFIWRGPWAGSLLFTGLRGQRLYRLILDKTNPSRVVNFETFLTGRFGRLRDVAQGPDDAVYVLTSNRDGRGQPTKGDDRILRLSLR